MYYQIDSLERLLIVDLVGQPTVDEVVDLIGKIHNDDRYLPSLNALFDLSRCDLSRCTTGQVRSLISSIEPLSEDSRLAILAPGDLAYGLARVYITESSLANDRPRNVFKDFRSAMAWIKADRD